MSIMRRLNAAQHYLIPEQRLVDTDLIKDFKDRLLCGICY